MKVKLIKGLSYSNDFITVTARNPVVEVSSENGADLIASGYFKLVDSDVISDITANENNEINNIAIEDTEKSSGYDVSKLKVAELDALATQLGIKFENSLSKSEKIEKISAFLNEHDV